MTQVIDINNPKPATTDIPSVAPLRNVGLFGELLDKLTSRDERLPGIGVFYGPSGFGKSFAAVYHANRTAAYYVEVKSTWTPGALCEAIGQAIGIRLAHSVARRVEDIGEELRVQNRALILDEADHLARSSVMIELVRDLYAASEAAIVLIGEEMLPRKLEKWERFHNRVLDWKGALPSTLNDLPILASIYAPKVTVEEGLATELIERTRGVTRRICVNLVQIQEVARQQGLERIGLSAFPVSEISTGRAPTARSGWGSK